MTASEEVDGAGPQPLLPARPEMSLPSNERFLLLRAEAKENGTLADLQKLVAAWQAVAARCDLAFDDLTRLAVYRMEVERDIGKHLAQTVHRGGNRAKSPGGALLREGCLPEDITKKQSRLYRSLAGLPEDVFRAYLGAAQAKRVVPSSAGARAFAAAPKVSAQCSGMNHKAKGGARSGADLPREVLMCVERIMIPDVVVGESAIPAKQRIQASTNGVLKRLHGDVFITECPEPQRWLAAIDQARREARVRRAVVVLPATPWARWFQGIERADWLLCFLRDDRDEGGSGVMLAHIGERPSVFRLAFRPLGVVMRAATAE